MSGPFVGPASVRNDAVAMVEIALDAPPDRQHRYLVKAFCAISVAVGIEAFTAAMKGAADELLGSG